MDDLEEMYAGENELCGTTMTSAGSIGHVECMEGLVCQAATDYMTYGYASFICVNDTTNYGEEPEEMYAAEDEHCGYTVTTAGEDGYIECMDGLVCKAVEDSSATDSYGYTTICINDTTDYGEGADGVWDGGETDITGFWT